MRLAVTADLVEATRPHALAERCSLLVITEDGDEIRVVLPDEVAERLARTQVPKIVAWLSDRDAARERARLLALGQTTIDDFVPRDSA